MTDTPVEALEPEALTAAYSAHIIHTMDPGRKGSGIEKAIRAYLAALSTHPQAPGVVKPLEWAKHPSAALWRAFCILGQYQVSDMAGHASWTFDGLPGQPTGTGDYLDNADEAKAAAQADYERRILSTLVSAPPVSAGELVEPIAWRTDIFEQMPNGKLSRIILDAEEVKESGEDWTPLVPASALTAANADRDRLEREFEGLRKAIEAKGGTEHAPTQDAYELACAAIEKHRTRADAAQRKLDTAIAVLKGLPKECLDSVRSILEDFEDNSK